MPITTTDVMKDVVRGLVAVYITHTTKKTLATHTDIDTDGLPVEAGCAVIGIVGSARVGKYTDKFVDTATIKFKSWKDRKNESTK